jgi:hypothetical protein
MQHHSHEERARRFRQNQRFNANFLSVIAAGSRALGQALMAPSQREPESQPRPQPTYREYLRTGRRPDLFF